MVEPLRDLEPRRNPKGGSPRTPTGGIPAREYQEYAQPLPTTVNGTGLWKMLTTGVSGLFIGMTVAWFGALQSKGVTQKDLHDYVLEFGRAKDEVLAIQQSNQDRQIGALTGKQDQIMERLNKAENNIDKCENGVQKVTDDLKNKMGTVADYLESQKTKK